ncbi:MAG: hypothetical protein Ct9H300mP31_07840 [Acidimicrobiaceae bacterium]|nr:MAG: hypothetical protein Ct9H300mP31_07840 [Acidimicrobiaceae bacterium]
MVSLDIFLTESDTGRPQANPGAEFFNRLVPVPRLWAE